MLYKKTLACLVSTSILGGCATASKDITAAYVSPVQYQGYDCQQLSMESQRINSRVTQLGGRLDEAASNDKSIAGVGMILFWPALFALGGTKQQEAEYARLKGEYDAVLQSAIAKKCDAPIAQAPAAREAGAGSPAPVASLRAAGSQDTPASGAAISNESK